MKFPKIGKIMDKLPNNVSRPIGRASLQTQKHSPTILFGAGVVGIVATVVLASRATLKVQDILDDADEKIEKIKLVEEDGDAGATKWTASDFKEATFSVRAGVALDIMKLYGPAVIVGIASVCALTGSHVILNKRNAALTAAYKVLEKGFEEYRERVREELGLEKDLEFNYGVEEWPAAVDEETGTTVETVRTYGNASKYARVFDETCTQFSRAPRENSIFLGNAQNHCNDRLRTWGHLFLNEVYDLLGMPRTKEGAIVGWIYDKDKTDGDGHVSFGIWDPEVNPPDLAVEFSQGRQARILLDFNVDGVIFDKI